MQAEAVDWSAKGRILRAAEALFADKGLESTSLREVALAAGQKNTNAVQYHFGSKEGLLKAIWQRHADGIEARRAGLLAEAAGVLTLQDVVGMLVAPVVDKLDDPDGGEHYLLIMSQLVSHPQQNILAIFDGLPEPSGVALMKQLGKYVVHLGEADTQLRLLFVTGLLFHGIADYIRLRKVNSPMVSNVTTENLKANLVRTLAAVVTAA